MNTKSGRGSDQFMLRLPDGMRERIKAAAEDNNRSMNAEIISRLQDTLDEKHNATLAISFDIADVNKRDIKEKMEAIAKHLQDIVSKNNTSSGNISDDA